MKLSKTALSLFLLAAMGAMFAPFAEAGPVINFGTTGSVGSGTMSYLGGTSALIGSNIKIKYVLGMDTFANSGNSLMITGGLLNFNTGAGSNTGGYNWTGTAGSTFTITGSIASLGLVNATLLSGTFGTAKLETNNTITLALGSDTKHASIMAHYGMPTNTVWNMTGHVSLGTAPSGGTITSSAFGADIANYGTVPEPGSLLLLSTGLLGLGGMIRWKTKQ